MSRTRLLRLAAAMFAVALTLSGLALLSTPANAAATKLAPKPKVGQCRTTTAAQSYAFTDAHKPVACSKPHRLRTFAVVNVPKHLDYVHVTDAKIGKVALAACNGRFWKSLGGTHANQALTAYSWVFFGPSLKDRKKGARWLRCDIVLEATTPDGYAGLAPLPNLSWPMLGSRPITDSIRRCLSDATHNYWTVCSRPHAARADQTFTMPNPTVPSQSAVNTAASTACPGKRAYATGAYSWSHGDHVITCYSITTS